MARVMSAVIGSKRRSSSFGDDLEDDPTSAHQLAKRVKREIIEGHRRSPSLPVDEGDDFDASGAESVVSEEEEELMLDDESDPEINIGEHLAAYEAHKATKPSRYAGEMRKSGIIKSITLSDFMCHRHMTADFGGKLNFLVGHNGSGKSAILTAIAIALGGKAAMTGRGQGMKDLIRKGAEKAVVTVVITNQGDEAYKPEIYNPYIVIERVINKSGSAPFNFRASRDGKIVANKREELSRILDKFQIHVDSPLTILTQDQARSFLSASDPSSLYKFFMQGTLLQSLANSYMNIQQSIDHLERHRTLTKAALPELKEAWQRLMRKERETNKMLEMRKELDTIDKELSWAYVADKERERDEQQQKVDDQAKRVENAKTKKKEAEATVVNSMDQLKDLEAEVVAATENEAPLEAKRDSQEKKLKEASSDIKALTESCRTCEESVQENAREVAAYDEQIANQANATARVDPAITKLKKGIDSHSDLLSNLRRQRPRSEQEVEEAEKAFDAAKEAESRAHEEAMQALRAEHESKEAVDNLRLQATNRLAAFGHNISIVMQEIDRARWVHSKPLGPLGMHVRLKDLKYRNAFHSVFGSTLCQFAVQCDQDRKTMMDILKRCKANGYYPGNSRRMQPSSVIQHAGDMYDYRSGDLSHLNATIMSQLEFDNEMVRRILINAHSIERTFVWPELSGTQPVARRIRELVRDGQNQCIFVTADGFNARGSASSESSGPLGSYNGNMLLTQNVETDIETHRNAHAEFMAKSRIAKEQHQSTVADRKKAEAVMGEKRRQLTKVTGGIRRAEEKIEQLRDELNEKEVVEQGVDLAEVREEAARRRRGAQEQLAALQERLGQYAQRQSELQAKLKETQEELAALAPQRTRRMEALTVLAQQRSHAVTNVGWYQQQLIKYEAALEQEKVVKKSSDLEVENWASEALRICVGVRHVPTRSSKELSQRRLAAQEAIKRSEKETGVSFEDITMRLKVADAKLRAAVAELQELGKFVTVLKNAMAQRQAFWKGERARYSTHANCVFISSMEKRDLDGVLQFDHVIGRLLIRVKETGGQSQYAQSTYKTPQTMSGGERSFTTVSLLLAMWDLSSGPIRCLDEWDVFLDLANRKVAANMLLEGARDSSETQYLLITPQDMSGITVDGPGNKIIKMADPIRNQGTLPFQAA